MISIKEIFEESLFHNISLLGGDKADIDSVLMSIAKATSDACEEMDRQFEDIKNEPRGPRG